MNKLLIVLVLWCCSLGSAFAQVSVGIGIGIPGVNIGINFPAYPSLVAVPGYPVYYAPQARSNYFFYDGMYWVYQQDNWYASTWYNGPWWLVEADAVPLYVLRVPVRYYRQPPAYFRGWRPDAPPRWGEHWGSDWDRRHSGWDRWDRRAAPRPAPLPTYQREYIGKRYPQQPERQQALQAERYRYQPRDAVVRQPPVPSQRQPDPAREQRPVASPRATPPAPPQAPPQARPREVGPRDRPDKTPPGQAKKRDDDDRRDGGREK